MSIANLQGLEPGQLAEEIVQVHGDDSEWLGLFLDALEQRRMGLQMKRILAVWGLNQSEAARLFGVSRQAISKWLASGVPTDRNDSVALLSAATDLLVRHLQRDRIPVVVRRRASALGDESLLGLVGAGRARDVLEACRTMFDFSRAQA